MWAPHVYQIGDLAKVPALCITWLANMSRPRNGTLIRASNANFN